MRRLRFDQHAVALALAASLPAVAAALVLLFTGGYTTKVQWTVGVAVVAAAAAGIALLQVHVVTPLHTLANLVAALREDDFSIRGRTVSEGDPLGAVMSEVNALAETLHELDIETERRFVEDLRATGLFLSVEPASATTRRPNLLAIRLPYEVDETAYCGEITVAPSILTAGLVPMRDCHRSYQIQFVNESTGATLSFQDTYSSDTWIGWIPIFMNFGEDWHWYGPPDDDLRIAYLRQDLSEIRSDLMRLAGVDDD